MQNFDLLIIGGGPAGYLAAERAGTAGLQTALIEKRRLGGVCLNEGCIPSKALLHAAKVYDYALHSDGYGVQIAGASIDHAAVLARKNRVVKKLVAGVNAKLRNSGVTVIPGAAVITGKNEQGFLVAVDGGETYCAQKLLIAAGSVPVVPPIPGLQEGLASGFVLTSREILDLAEAPNELIVVGGGVIGLEMASYYNAIGAKVTVIEMLGKIAGPAESEVSAILLKNYQKKGIAFHLGCRVTAITENGVTYADAAGEKTIPADKVLLSIGRRPAAEDLGLASIGVETRRGAIPTDDHLRTNVTGVYAAGDINGKSMLAHTAYREAEVAVHHMLGQRDRMRYGAIPSVIYTTPEVACVGETEESAQEKGIDYAVAKLPLAYAGRYVAEVDAGDGICKLLMDKAHQTLIGAHIIGSYASEIIYGAGMMIELEMRIKDIQEIVFPHPTVGEIVRETLFAF